MTDDIVTRLQFHAEEIINGREIEVIPGTYLVEAADEIERLRNIIIGIALNKQVWEGFNFD